MKLYIDEIYNFNFYKIIRLLYISELLGLLKKIIDKLKRKIVA